MNSEMFDIDKFNIIQDEDNYYFFRALNMADNRDIEEGITTSANGEIERIRTDRERYEEEAKYSENSQLSLEEIYDHIKMHYRKDTNCISLTSNSNIAINYGRGLYKDKYVMIRIPKAELGEKTVVAGKYMLQELSLKIEQALENLPQEKLQRINSLFREIEGAQNDETLRDVITKRYTAKNGEVELGKAHLRKGIIYSSPNARISSYQSLNDEQRLETNKVYAKLAILENEDVLRHVIPHSSNSKLRETIGNAFSSTEVIHYGEIEKKNIIDVSKEVVDLFALIQQIDGIEKNRVEQFKKALLTEIKNGATIPTLPEIEQTLKDNVSIDEMYKITEGTVEYGKAKSIVKNMFYLSKARKNAIELSNSLREILGNNSEFEDVIEYIRNNGFRVEPEIISRKSGKGVKLSESVNLNLQREEQTLIEDIKKLSSDELEEVLQNGGLVDIQNIITKTYGKETEKIDISRYYAEAIVSKYNWQEIGIEEFKLTEKNELIKRLQEKDCIDIYNKIKEAGITEEQIPTVLLNIATRQGLYEKYKNGNLEQLLKENKEVLQGNLSIEVVERFLGYYDVKDTGIRLKDYQQRAFDKTDEIFETHKFAQVVLPTGAGKSFVAISQMQQFAKEHPNEKMLYLAPQDEILNQIKKYIVKYVHGEQNTVGKSVDEIVSEVFPNITFETYTGLLAKRGQEVIKEQYGMIVSDELHRTGAKEWEGKIDELFANQSENVKVLGITATPERDVDGRDMAEETARKLGYTDEEIKQRKYLASNMTLENAIRMGYVVNPKLVYSKYDLILSGKLDELKEEIDEIEDKEQRTEKLEKYNKVKAELIEEIDKEIGKEARIKLEQEARKNLDSGIGKDEILRQHVKKGGKYIVFIPVTDQGEIEDEDGNRIGSKTGEDKLKAYQEYLNKVFEGTDIKPQCHAMSGSWNGKNKNKAGEDKNQQELNAFEADNSEETKFMVVMNKANEGLHIGGVDGIIWFRALDENTRILYLQQLGRAIYALDEDNPLPDDKRPVIIDLANNSLTVKIEKDFEREEPEDDLESLTIIKEWIDNHNGMFPDRNSSNKQEQHYYAVLRRIQSKYSKYLEKNFDFENVSDEQKYEVQKILEIASEIDLWNIDLPPIPKTRGNRDEFDPFTIEGILKDFVELEDEVEEQFGRSICLKNALKIEKWCKENFGEKEKWERRLPSKGSKDEEEKRLATALSGLMKKKKQYEGQETSSISNEVDRNIVEIMRRIDREYAYGRSQTYHNVGTMLEIENWCKENYGEKEKWERRLPNTNSKDEEEKRLADALSGLMEKKKQYEGQEISSISNEVDRNIVEIIRRIEKEYAYGAKQTYFNVGTMLEIENWCKEKYGEKEKWERRLPSKRSEDEEEKRLAQNLNNLNKRMKQKYEGEETSSISNEVDRNIVEIMRRIDREYAYGWKQTYYSLGQILEIENWCKENFGEKEKWERRLPNTKSKDEEEKRLADALRGLMEKKKQYEGQEISSISNEVDRNIVEIIRRIEKEYAYGLHQTYHNVGTMLEIENWCKENFGEKEKWERRIPSIYSKDKEEKRLAQNLNNLKRGMKKYEGQEISSIPDEVDREVLEIMERLDREYNPEKARLDKAKSDRDLAKTKNEQAKELEEQVSEQLKERGQTHEEQ